MENWRNISLLNVKDDREPGLISRRESVTYLGVYSEKAAILLNEVINWKMNTCKIKSEYYLKEDKNGRIHRPRSPKYYNDTYFLCGGGLFVKCNAEVAISSVREVCLKFKEDGNEYIKKYVRVASGVDEMTKAIKEKIANELKKFWTTYAEEIDNDKILEIEETNESGEEIVFKYHEADYHMNFSKDEMLINSNQNMIKQNGMK